MELRQLRYFLAIVEEANFTRASEKVFVSQSALSQQIQLLEQELGTVLLDRSKRGVRLTAAGEILCHHAQRIFLELERAQTAMQELEGLQRGKLRIGVVQTVNAYLMPTLVTAFIARYPEIKLSIEELSSDEIERGLEQGHLQVGVGFAPPANLMIESEPLFEEQLVLVVRDDHALANQRLISVKALDHLPMIMLSNTFCTRRLWEESARLADAEPRVVMEMNTVRNILSVVAKTGLATVLPKLSLLENQIPNVVSVDLHNPTPSRQVGMLWHRENYLCSATRAFIDMTRSVAAQTVEVAAATS